jgi:hypothetical protein
MGAPKETAEPTGPRRETTGKSDRGDPPEGRFPPSKQAERRGKRPRSPLRERLLGSEVADHVRPEAAPTYPGTEAVRLAASFVARECESVRDGGFEPEAQWVATPGFWAVAFSRAASDHGLEITEYMPFAVRVEHDGRCSFIIWGAIWPVDSNGHYKKESTRIEYTEKDIHRWDPRFPGNGGEPVDRCHILSEFAPDETKPLSARQAVALINRGGEYAYFTTPPNHAEAHWLEEPGYWVFIFHYIGTDGVTHQ